MSHPYLAALPAPEQHREIAGSKARLEALTGCAVRHFSYPHGDHDAETKAFVRQAGFEGACGTAAEAIRPGCDVFALPRVEAPDLDGDRFGRWLAEWIG